MKVLLVLVIAATARAALISPANFQYQNIKASPWNNFYGGSGSIDLNSAIVSSTPSPLALGNELGSSTVDGNSFESIVSSTPQTPIVSSTSNEDNVNSEYGSSTPAPALLNSEYFGSSTPAPDLSNNEYFSSTPAPLLNNEFFSSTSSPLSNNGFFSSTSSPLSNNGFFSSTSSPLLNNGFFSSTSSPLLNNGLFSSTSSPLLNNEYFSSTSSPLLNNELFSSTSSPLFNNGLFSSTSSPLLNNEYFSSTAAPGLLNQNFNSYLAPNIQSNPIDFSQFSAGINGFSQSIPSGLGEFNSVTVKSTTSGGSLSDAFGISDGILETQSQKPDIAAKNVYFFAAPEEHEPIRARVLFEQNKKNVNVVFIKAPAAPSLGTIEITPPRQESPEKTVVYVLVKKPEEQQNILVKSAPVVKPNKPDVFFIKYKNEEEAQHSISKVQAQHGTFENNQQFGQELTQSAELFNIENAKYSFQPKPITQYISGGALVRQSVNPSSYSTSTESTLGNVNFGINNVPLVYTTPRPQVEINQISNNDNLDNFITIGGRLGSSDILSSTASPIIESSSFTPYASSSPLPVSFSTTVRPSILGLNPFLKKK